MLIWVSAARHIFIKSPPNTSQKAANGAECQYPSIDKKLFIMNTYERY